MTKEELKQKAEEYATENYEQCIYDDVRGWENDFQARKEAYIAGATENTTLLSKHIIELQADKGRLTDQLTKAKEIIKKIEKIFYSGENAIKRLSKISDIFKEAEQFLSEVEK